MNKQPFMKSILTTGTSFARANKPPLLLAAASALCLLSSALWLPSLHAQNTPDPAQLAPSLQPPGVKPAQKPKSDKWVFSLLPVGLQKNPQVDYAIFTEMTNAGRKLPDPSQDNPVYYIAAPVGQRDVGDAYGGTKAIPYDKLQKLLSNSLAANGYRLTEAASTEHPPTQVLFFAWGMHNKIDTSLDAADETGETSADSGEGGLDSFGSGETGADAGGAIERPAMANSLAADSSVLANLLSRAKIVGGRRFAAEYAQAMMAGSKADFLRFAERNETTEVLVYAVQNECYYLLVTSMDAEALARRERKVLWTTTISTVSQGLNFEATLPVMVSNVSYYFGRETVVPEILRKTAYRRVTVEIGDMDVVEMDSSSTTTGTTAKPAPATSGTTSGKR
jgi:hypothetical protein